MLSGKIFMHSLLYSDNQNKVTQTFKKTANKCS